MFRSRLVLASITAVFLLYCQAQATLYTSYWWECNGGEWGDPCNWESNPGGGGVPDNNGNTFDVYIWPSAPGLSCSNEVEIKLTQNRTINKLDCYDEVYLESWGNWSELTLSDLVHGLTNYGYLEIEQIDINGNVKNWSGTLVLCDMDIEGDLTNYAGAWTEVEYEVNVGDETGGGDISNSGIVRVHSGSEFWVDSDVDNWGEFWVYDGVFGSYNLTNYSSGRIGGFGIIGSEGLFDNGGEIIAYGGSLAIWCETLTNTGTLSNMPLSSLQINSVGDIWNAGTIYVNAGGGAAFDCNLVNTTNGLVELLGGTLAATTITQTANAEFSGFGSIAGNILVQANAKIDLDGPTYVIGDVNMDSGATLKISGGQTLITGHTKNDGTIVLAGGTVLFQGGYSGSGEIIDNPAPSSEVIIDNGDTGTSSIWTWNISSASGCYGTSSLYSLVNGASYSFEAWVLGFREVSLWWTAWSNRSDAVSVEIYDGSALLDTVSVNQQVNGGKWNTLGYYTFIDKAKVKIISNGSAIVVADAVKFAPAPSEIVIDDGDTGTSSSGSWNISSFSDYYGVNSLYSLQSGASYSFDARILGAYEISLWWTANSNRSDAVSVEIYDGVTKIGTLTVNQKINGGKWNSLGNYSFSDTAKVKILSDGSAVVVADAVKFTPL